MTKNGGWVSPDPSSHNEHTADILKQLTHQTKELKTEVKELFTELKLGEEELRTVEVETQEVRKAAQQERIKGNELMKLPHLQSMGFDDDFIQDHLEQESNKLQKNLKAKQTDRKNIETNIQKMELMNKQSAAAVSAAQTVYNNSVVENSKLQALLDTAELKLYAAESKVKHMSNMKSVELTNKDAFKRSLKGIVREVQTRCDDEKLVRDVLRIASKCLAADLSTSSHGDLNDDDSSSDSSNSSISVSSTSSDESD